MCKYECQQKKKNLFTFAFLTPSSNIHTYTHTHAYIGTQERKKGGGEEEGSDEWLFVAIIIVPIQFFCRPQHAIIS